MRASSRRALTVTARRRKPTCLGARGGAECFPATDLPPAAPRPERGSRSLGSRSAPRLPEQREARAVRRRRRRRSRTRGSRSHRSRRARRRGSRAGPAPPHATGRAGSDRRGSDLGHLLAVEDGTGGCGDEWLAKGAPIHRPEDAVGAWLDDLRGIAPDPCAPRSRATVVTFGFQKAVRGTIGHSRSPVLSSTTRAPGAASSIQPRSAAPNALTSSARTAPRSRGTSRRQRHEARGNDGRKDGRAPRGNECERRRRDEDNPEHSLSGGRRPKRRRPDRGTSAWSRGHGFRRPRRGCAGEIAATTATTPTTRGRSNGSGPRCTWREPEAQPDGEERAPS